VRKNYQTQTASARITGRTTPKKARIDPHRDVHEAALALADTVTVAIDELAGELEEGLLAFAVGTGLKVLGVILDNENLSYILYSTIQGVRLVVAPIRFKSDNQAFGSMVMIPPRPIVPIPQRDKAATIATRRAFAS